MYLFRTKLQKWSCPHFVIPAPSVNYSEKRQNETFERRSIFLDFFFELFCCCNQQIQQFYTMQVWLPTLLPQKQVRCLLSLKCFNITFADIIKLLRILCQNSKLFSNFCIASILIFNGVIDRWHDCGSFLTSFGFQDTQNLAVILIVWH